MKNFKVSSSANGKVFRNGLYSTAILAAAIVLAVLINLLVGAIPKKYTEFDLSAAKMYTLGDSSRQLMQSLDQDVTVYYLCETGSEDAIITKLLDHYADESGHFHWEQKDPALYPTFAAQYGAENASTGSLIVVSGENSEVLNAAELYEYDYSDYYTTGAANLWRRKADQLCHLQADCRSRKSCLLHHQPRRAGAYLLADRGAQGAEYRCPAAGSAHRHHSGGL